MVLWKVASSLFKMSIIVLTKEIFPRGRSIWCLYQKTLHVAHEKYVNYANKDE